MREFGDKGACLAENMERLPWERKGIEYEGTPNKASSLEISINMADY